jgi:hypothetical protein
MERITQQINQKPPFPIKTKIAVYLMILLAMSRFAHQVFILYNMNKTMKEFDSSGFGSDFSPISFFAPTLIIGVLIFFLIAFFLLKRKVAAWYFAIVIFSLEFLQTIFPFFMTLFQKGFSSIGKFNFFYFLLELVLIVLLLIDRKNFFMIAS